MMGFLMTMRKIPSCLKLGRVSLTAATGLASRGDSSTLIGLDSLMNRRKVILNQNIGERSRSPCGDDGRATRSVNSAMFETNGNAADKGDQTGAQLMSIGHMRTTSFVDRLLHMSIIDRLPR